MYRKPTHTDQYLHWDSNHHITAKQSVYNTLAHRTKTVSSTQDLLDKELSHIKTALHHYQFPAWALNQWEHKFKHPSQDTTTNNTNTNNSTSNNNQDSNNNYKTTIVVPYIPNTADRFRKLAKEEVFRYISKAQTHLEQHWATLRTRTQKPTRQWSSTNTNAHTSTVPALTLENLADHWEKGLKNA